MSATIDSITEANPHLFTTGGAYAQAFSLFDAAIALGTIFGPVCAGFIYHVGNWWIMSLTLALVCASGALPVVSECNALALLINSDLQLSQLKLFVR